MISLFFQACTNGIISLNRNSCPFSPKTYGTEIDSQWPIIAPFYSDLTFAAVSSGEPPYLLHGTFLHGASPTDTTTRASADVNKLLGTSNYEALVVSVVTWYYARAFGSNEVNFASNF